MTTTDWGGALNERRDALAAHLYRQFTFGPAPAFIRLSDQHRDWWRQAADDALDRIGVLDILQADPSAH